MSTISREDIILYLKTHKKFLEEQFGVTKIALFGSYARHEATIDSDIDLLVEMKEEDLTQRYYLRQHLEKQFNRKVDVGYFNTVHLYILRDIEEDLIYA